MIGYAADYLTTPEERRLHLYTSIPESQTHIDTSDHPTPSASATPPRRHAECHLRPSAVSTLRDSCHARLCPRHSNREPSWGKANAADRGEGRRVTVLELRGIDCMRSGSESEEVRRYVPTFAEKGWSREPVSFQEMYMAPGAEGLPYQIGYVVLPVDVSILCNKC